MEPPSTGSFYFRNYDFENAWRAISKVVDSIMGLGTAGLINSEEWCDAFYQIYMMHMCFEDPYGANFYSRVADHFRAFAAKVLEALRPLDSIEFSEKYRTEWEKYCLATTYINRLFDSFNRSLRKLKSGLIPMKSSDSESPNIDVSQFHEISDLMLECWGAVIIENIREKINENFAIYFQEIIEDESDSVTFRRLPLVKAFAASIHTTGPKSVHNNSPDCSPNNDFEDNNLMKLIKERAEFVRLKWFDNYESENFDDYLSKLSKYLSKIFVITSNVLDENTEFLRSLRQKLADLIIDRRQKEIVQNFQKNLIAKGENSNLLSGENSHSDSKSYATEDSTKKDSCCQSTAGSSCDSKNAIVYEEALDIVLKEIEQLDKEIQSVDINNSIGLICAKTVRSKIAVPSCPKSIMDGYALTGPASKSSVFDIYIDPSEKTSNNSNDYGYFDSYQQSTTYKNQNTHKNYCYKISTGHAMPKTTKAVVPVEATKLINTNSQIIVLENVEIDQHIRKIGEDIAFNEIVIQKGQRITEAYAILLKSLGFKKIEAYEQLKINLLATGDEVVNFEKTPDSNQVFDLNSPLLELEIAAKKLGMVTNCGIMTDDFEKLKTKISQMINDSDIVITSGGTSMGEKDYIEPVLKKLNCHIHFNRVKIKPGKPTIFATCFINGTNKYIFCLPGNPVSCWVSYQIFVLPFICKLLNIPPPPVINVKIANNVSLSDSRQEFLRGRLIPSSDKIQMVEILHGEQHSSRFLSICGCDVLVIIPSSLKKLGEVVKGMILEGILI